MLKRLVYRRDELLGEADVYLLNQKVDLREKDIRITHFSQPSERCPPLAVLHTITSCGLCFKMESKMLSHESPLFSMHLSCFRENKTAVMTLGGDELHLVALSPHRNGVQHPCFWGFIIASGLYSSCLAMLNLRCLGIVFDLDETLIVANTMRSFEDRIEALQRKINTEIDAQRISGMLAEVKRYQDDKMILKQYAENDQVVENGKIMRIQPEVVPALSDSHQSIIRPIIRLQEKNIVLTRINPVIRDTSVLVRLRPAWEELRSYLTARGRKRFDVYVCTMAERDYALEIWRLLDPDFNLINSKQLLDRIVCVKSGSKKSLFNVFQNGTCDPKMALVIDDRLKVWDEKDQPRVHVVPAFAPYYAPQAEENNTIPVLCVARNVACNVRGGFFRDFDDHLLKRISGVSYEDDIRCILSPDVGNYLVSEDEGITTNGNKDVPSFDGMADAEVEKRLKEAASASSTLSSSASILDPRTLSSTQCTVAPSYNSPPLPATQVSTLSTKQLSTTPTPSKQFSHVDTAESSIQSSAREEGEVPESELDPDTRRRLLILQHGQDSREHSSNETPYPVRASLTVPAPILSSRAPWFPMEKVMSPGKFSDAASRKMPMDMEFVDRHKPPPTPFISKAESPITSAKSGYGNQRLSKETFNRDERERWNHLPTSYRSYPGEEVPSALHSRDEEFDFRCRAPSPPSPVNVLHKIAMKCGTKVEYKPSLVDSKELRFCIEVLFSDEKVGEGIGRTRREAQHQAADEALKNLAYKYLSTVSSNRKDNGFSIPSDPRMVAPKRPLGSVPALKDCMEGLSIIFQGQDESVQKEESHAHQSPLHGKRLKPDVGRVMQRVPSSIRYPN